MASSQDFSLSLKGKVALISGSAKENGIGAAIAKTLAMAGARVAINYTSDASAERAKVTVANIEQAAGKGSVIVIREDVSTKHGTENLVRETLKGFNTDTIDILVNNAAVTAGGPILSEDPSTIERVFAVNVFGYVYLIRAAMPHMPRGGRIINIGSVVSKLALNETALYGASKAAMDNLTFTMAKEVGRNGKGITINTVAPGPVETDAYPTQPAAKGIRDHLMALTRVEERTGTVSDIADAVLLLTSERSRWISGQYISVSGGITGS